MISMKFLVTATPIVPLNDSAILNKLGDWMREHQRAGRITDAYGLVGGGGCSVMDVASLEELHEMTELSPIGSYMAFDIKPLIELGSSLAMGKDHLPA
jgi:muconolactone delta-isomerase